MSFQNSNLEWLSKKKVSQNFWTKLSNQKAYVEWIASKLNIKNKEDWYKITQQVW